MENEKKNTWGGKRANAGGKRDGAGRKPIDRDPRDVPKHRGISFTDNEWDKIKALAAESGLSVPKFILDRLGI